MAPNEFHVIPVLHLVRGAIPQWASNTHSTLCWLRHLITKYSGHIATTAATFEADSSSHSDADIKLHSSRELSYKTNQRTCQEIRRLE